MHPIELIGVRFDGSGRQAGQSAAPAALRHADVAGLTPDVPVSQPTPARGPAGFVNERALLEMTGAVQARVGAALADDRFLLLYGGD